MCAFASLRSVCRLFCSLTNVESMEGQIDAECLVGE